MKIIDVNASGDLAYWLKALNTTHDALLAAIVAVGPEAEAVRAYLNRGSNSEPPAVEQRPDGG